MIIGLTGLARSGKDTTGKILSEILEYETYALASPLKSIINSIFGWDSRHSDGELKEVTNRAHIKNWKSNLISECRFRFKDLIEKTTDDSLCSLFYRKVLLPGLIAENNETQSAALETSPRKVYQAFGTEFGRAIHPELWIELAKIKANKLNGNLIVTDVRFENEANWIKSDGGKIVKLERSSVEEVNNHVSEKGISKKLVDFTVVNNGDIESLKDSVSSLVDYLLTPSHAIDTSSILLKK